MSTFTGTHHDLHLMRPAIILIGLLLFLLLFAFPLRAATVTTDKTSYLVLQPVTVTYSGLPGNSNDWISVGLATDPDGSNGIQYFYTGGKTSGTLTFGPLQNPGNYQARVYYKDGLSVQVRSAFTVTFPTPQISLDKPSYLVLQQIVVTYSNMPGYPKDYITISPAASADSVYGQYIFTNSAKSGSMTFNDLEPGKYEARVHFNNDDSTVRARIPFTVSYPVPQISTNKSSYLVLEKITVNYSNMPGYAKDYVTLVTANTPDTLYGPYLYTNSAKSGSLTFDPQPPGKYEARIYFNNDETTVRARVAFTISNPVPLISTDRTSYPVLQKIIVTYSNMPGYGTDFITLAPSGSKDDTIGQYFNTGGAKSGTMTFDDQAPGNYEVRVHFNNDNNVVYARAAFTVSFPTTTLTTSKPQYQEKEPITVTYSNMPGYAKDYVTVVPAGSPENYYTQYLFTGGARNGSMTFDPLAAGRYEARAHYNNEDAVVRARVTFSVGAACSFTLSPAAATVPAAGFSGSVSITATSSTCQWQASTNSSWIGITSGTSGTGNGIVNYRVSANADPNPRSSSLTIAGQTFAITQSAASQIQITTVANAASLTPAVMASGGIAQGAIFSILGTALGPGDPMNPATGISATPPYATTLANVAVQVTQGGTTVSAYPVFVWASRIDAILPSTVPVGAVNITVTYNDSTSASTPATVVASNFGAYATNGKSGGRAVLMMLSSPSDPGIQNSNTQTALPGQLVSLIGTGLGAISAADNAAPPAGDLPVMSQVKVLVGGKPAAAVHASRLPGQPGKDQIQFLVPSDAAAGCNTPVQVVTGSSTYSNMVTMAIDANGKVCSSVNPWSGLADQSGKFANIFLLRLQASVALSADQDPLAFTMDEGLAAFTNEAAGGGPLLGLLASIPTLGTCGALGGSLNIGSLLGPSSNVPGAQAIQYLDAGPGISVSGPVGTGQLVPGTTDDGTPIIPSMYGAVLGGGLGVLFGSPDPPPFFEPGTYTVSGSGGKDVGPFSTSLTIPPPITWTNRDALTTIDRGAGVTFKWSGGSEAQFVLLAGISSDPATNATSGFVCFAPSSQGSLSVPPPVLANLSATDANGSMGALLVGTVPAGTGSTFTASGLDSGMAFYGAFNLKTVAVK